MLAFSSNFIQKMSYLLTDFFKVSQNRDVSKSWLNYWCSICITCSIHIFINVIYLPVLFNNHWEISLCWSVFTRPPPPPDPHLHLHPSPPPSHNSAGWGCEEHQEAEPYPWWRRTWAELERELTEPKREDTPPTSSSPPVNQTVLSSIHALAS